MSETVYSDSILSLARDPNLVRDANKELQLVKIIRELAERNLSRLCLACTAVLRSLEKIALRLKSWEFLSLDINSDNHFENNDVKMREFNNNLADKVMSTCQDCNRKVCALAVEIDRISKATRNLSPSEYASDGGTLLLSLLLRSINLKSELVESITVAYLKSKLILIGKDLESMLVTEDDKTTILTYKSFISNLLKQLDSAIELEDSEAKMECLAVISDMEKMFESFKLEKTRELARKKQSEYDSERSRYEEEKAAWLANRQREINHGIENATPEYNNNVERPRSSGDSDREQHHQKFSKQAHRPSMLFLDSQDSDDNLFCGSDENSMSFSTCSKDHAPLIHSITNLDTSRSHRRNSVTTVESSNLLHKTTISDEMPYLMTAFSSVKNIQKDISHFKMEEEQEEGDISMTASSSYPTKLNTTPATTNSDNSNLPKRKPFNISYSSKLSSHPLQMNNTLLNPRYGSIGAQQVYSNNTLLLKMGIRPQVIHTSIPSSEFDNKHYYQTKRPNTAPAIMEAVSANDSDKENNDDLIPLTRANLESHTMFKPELNEIVEGVD